jgi:hypothetical protein
MIAIWKHYYGINLVVSVLLQIAFLMEALLELQSRHLVGFVLYILWLAFVFPTFVYLACRPWKTRQTHS